MTYKERLNEYLAAIKDGDETKFEDFVLNTYGPLLNVARYYLFNKSDAELVMSDVYLKIYLYADKYDTTRDAQSYIWQIIKNRAIDYNKQHYRHKNINIEDIPAFDTIDHFDRVLTRTDLCRALNKIDKQDAWLFIWTSFCGHTQEDVAQKLNITRSAVCQRLDKTKKKLREILNRR